jgi:hypothetical protein
VGKPSFENLSKVIATALKKAKRKTPEKKRA